ncbi:MAG: hypothetical protein KatS3mg114_0524 [Planctomycetaceae bacterium]|nr:MAG: hypothetical protein KatS3mg114_0524 [Planctomycetaceae bacterium]
MSHVLRTRSSLHLPITLSVLLMVLNATLMVSWIVVLAQSTGWGALITGTVVFLIILAGLSLYMVLMIKEVRLNQRQANFIDSVTHELKSPIASLRLYLETLQMRMVNEEQRHTFYHVMEKELERLDHLITQLLEVGRLDAIGMQADPEDVSLPELLQRCARSACALHKREEQETVEYHLQPAVVHARPLVVETIFRNLIDNAIKYGGEPPRVEIHCKTTERHRVIVQIIDNGPGIPANLRRRVFKIFFRAGSELTRTRQGTGLGLYIVQTLIRQLKGRITIHDRTGQPGSIFEVDLPGKAG